jgi:hypothetical protein
VGREAEGDDAFLLVGIGAGDDGFRLAIKADLGSRIVRAWAIVPATFNERQVAEDLLGTGPPPCDLLADKGFNGKALAAAQAARGTAVLVPSAKDQRAATAPILLKIIAQWRNRIETTFSEITNLMELARHGAQTFWGLLTRTAVVDVAPAFAGGLDELEHHRQPGRPGAGSLGDLGPQSDRGEGGLDRYLQLPS